MTWYLFGIYEKIEVPPQHKKHTYRSSNIVVSRQHTEFFNGNWSKKAGEHTSQNVLRMIGTSPLIPRRPTFFHCCFGTDYFNYTSSWVATLLVTEKVSNEIRLFLRFVWF
jgi:hypothetical protein